MFVPYARGTKKKGQTKFSLLVVQRPKEKKEGCFLRRSEKDWTSGGGRHQARHQIRYAGQEGGKGGKGPSLRTASRGDLHSLYTATKEQGVEVHNKEGGAATLRLTS